MFNYTNQDTHPQPLRECVDRLTGTVTVEEVVNVESRGHDRKLVCALVLVKNGRLHQLN